jgi:hypothetical protein
MSVHNENEIYSISLPQQKNSIIILNNNSPTVIEGVLEKNINGHY